MSVAAAIVFVLPPPRSVLGPILGWALALFVVRVATGMFLLTATEEGPGPPHIGVPLLALAGAGIARLRTSDRSARRDPFIGVVCTLVVAGAVVGLGTGLAA